MDFDQIVELIMQDALVLIPVLFIIGYMLRRTPVVPDWLVIWLQLLTGLVGTFLLLGAGFNAFVQGVLVTGASVLLEVVVADTRYAVQRNEELKDE